MFLARLAYFTCFICFTCLMCLTCLVCRSASRLPFLTLADSSAGLAVTALGAGGGGGGGRRRTLRERGGGEHGRGDEREGELPQHGASFGGSRARKGSGPPRAFDRLSADLARDYAMAALNSL